MFSKVLKLGKASQRLDAIEDSVSILNTKVETSLEKMPCAAHHDDLTKIKSVLVGKYPKAFAIELTKV